jgi:hypothetical protein
MATLITYHSSGGDSGRCDARCYNANHAKCSCICGGSNHGVGLERALDNARDRAESWVEQARANGQDVASFEVAMIAQQEPLFRLSEVA